MAASRIGYLTIENILSKASRDKYVKKLLKASPPLVYPPNLKKSAVLIPICVDNEQVSLLYTRRSATINSHRGEVSFPGGMHDLKDETFTNTALRETEEELGIPKSSVDVWTEMAGTFPGRKFDVLITPVVGFIDNFNSIPIKINETEVEDYFTVSFDRLTDPQYLASESYGSGYTLPVFQGGKHKIWGVTAVMTQAILASLLPKEAYDPAKQPLQIPSVVKTNINLI